MLAARAVGAEGRPRTGGVWLHKACSGLAPGEWSACEWVHTIIAMLPPLPSGCMAARHRRCTWSASAGPGSMAMKPVLASPTR